MALAKSKYYSTSQMHYVQLLGLGVEKQNYNIPENQWKRTPQHLRISKWRSWWGKLLWRLLLNHFW